MGTASRTLLHPCLVVGLKQPAFCLWGIAGAGCDKQSNCHAGQYRERIVHPIRLEWLGFLCVSTLVKLQMVDVEKLFGRK
jgi:hypothetical protein